MQQHCIKYFARVNRSKVNFSEHGNVAYRNKGNHEMQQNGHTVVEIVMISLAYFFIELTTEN